MYSALGSGSAISALTKKILGYELLNRICEKCARWSTATIFNMPAPLENMPTHYLNKIEGVLKLAVEKSMQRAADEINLSIYSTPSSVPVCINTAEKGKPRRLPEVVW